MHFNQREQREEKTFDRNLIKRWDNFYVLIYEVQNALTILTKRFVQILITKMFRTSTHNPGWINRKVQT